MNQHSPIIQINDPTPSRTQDIIRVFIRDCRVDLLVCIYRPEMQRRRSR